MRKVYIVSACRTPIGKMGGALAAMSAVDLGAIVLREALKRAGLASCAVDHVYLGCALQAGLGQNVARQAVLKAGLPVTTTAQTVNSVCGSGLDAVNSAAHLIQTGEANVVLAGGTESMSNAPFALPKARFGYRMGNPMTDTPLVDIMVRDGLWDAINDYHMGITAENVAEQWNLTRQELDEYAVQSQKKAVEAVANGRFKAEIVPVTVKSHKEITIVDIDEGPRPDVTAENLARLRPAFKLDGMITAGNSSSINDGAAAVLLISEEKARELGVRPLAEWLGGALAGVDPAIMGIGPIASTKKLLSRAALTMEDIDLVEANEAFAAQAIAVQRELRIMDEKLNVNGGAIALGHPIGATGCRILVTLLYAMQARKAKTGLATLCIGGGMGCSTLVKSIEN